VGKQATGLGERRPAIGQGQLRPATRHGVSRPANGVSPTTVENTGRVASHAAYGQQPALSAAGRPNGRWWTDRNLPQVQAMGPCP